jgi:hypothetical protein
MKVSDMFPSKYLAADDLQGRAVPVTIRDVEYDEMRDPRSGKKIFKPVIYFEKKVKGLVLNKTNAFAIAAVLGDDTERWKGGKIVIYPDRTLVAGTERDCIRVRSIHDEDAKTKPTGGAANAQG